MSDSSISVTRGGDSYGSSLVVFAAAFSDCGHAMVNSYPDFARPCDLRTAHNSVQTPCSSINISPTTNSYILPMNGSNLLMRHVWRWMPNLAEDGCPLPI